MIETIKRPYELLVRWREGKISGAHVGFEVTTIEDGTVLSTTPLNVMAVDIGQGAGFPLADILQQVQVDALTERDAANEKAACAEKECAEHQSALKAAHEVIAKHEESIKARDATIAELAAKLEENAAVLN